MNATIFFIIWLHIRRSVEQIDIRFYMLDLRKLLTHHVFGFEYTAADNLAPYLFTRQNVNKRMISKNPVNEVTCILYSG